MRAIWIGCGLIAGAAPAQAQYVMPGGTPIGRSTIAPVGTQQPQVGTQFAKVGQPAGYNGPDGKFTIEKPVQQTVDPRAVVAPYPGMPGAGKDFWDRLYDRSLSLMGLNQPKIVQKNWTPGLARRNRERREESVGFRRD